MRSRKSGVSVRIAPKMKLDKENTPYERIFSHFKRISIVDQPSSNITFSDRLTYIIRLIVDIYPVTLFAFKFAFHNIFGCKISIKLRIAAVLLNGCFA